jgi:hypothetical protein
MASPVVVCTTTDCCARLGGGCGAARALQPPCFADGSSNSLSRIRERAFPSLLLSLCTSCVRDCMCIYM